MSNFSLSTIASRTTFREQSYKEYNVVQGRDQTFREHRPWNHCLSGNNRNRNICSGNNRANIVREKTREQSNQEHRSGNNGTRKKRDVSKSQR
jgi:hypothetical protein